MRAEIRSSSGISLVENETILFEKRILFVTGEITEESADEFQKNMLVLQTRDAGAPIDLVITSCGGSIEAGAVYLDYITHAPMPVRLYCSGYAYSMAAVIFACGRKGERTMFPGSELMLHAPRLEGSAGSKAQELEEASRRLRKKEQMIRQLLSEHTGRTGEEIGKACSSDHFYTPEEALAFGLCDQIGMPEGWR